MKIRIILSALLICSSPLAVQAAERVTASSGIASVTVFADRAQVTRQASLKLKPGINLVLFDSLPLLLAEDSLRVEGKGSGEARIAGLTVRNVYLERLQEQKIRELEEELRSLNRKVEGIEARRKALASQKAFIDSIRVGWGERISKELALGKPTSAELQEAVKFVGEGIGRVEEQTYQAEAEKRPLLEQIAALKKQLEQSRGDRNQEVRAVEVAIEANRSMQFDLELSYLVGQAHWEPAYDVRLDAEGKSAELIYRGIVWQRSGEDWSGVKLALSTASPEAGGAPPELSPWHVGFYVPPRPIPLNQRSTLMGSSLPAPAAEAAPADGFVPQEKALPMPAQVSEGESSVNFNIVQPVEIPADGTRQGTVIAIAKVPVAVEYLSVPKLSQRVYLKSQVTNSTAYPLLSGPVNIFNDATFTGKEMLKTVAAGDKFDLFFGADHQIKVKRESAKVQKQAGLLSSNKVTYRISVELENLKKKGVTVTLLDQLPLPANEEIKVHLSNAEPRPDEIKPDGTLLWKVPLAPGEKKHIPYEIVIEFPKGRDLIGVE